MPPARGIIAANSPYDSAPAMVSAPATAHATKSQFALPIWRPMSAETMKIPDPIITPTTTITESNKPRPRAKFVGEELAVEVGFVRSGPHSCATCSGSATPSRLKEKRAAGGRFVYYIQ
jgi:hypothetical protein